MIALLLINMSKKQKLDILDNLNYKILFRLNQT
jgi:hypothetical protein